MYLSLVEHEPIFSVRLSTSNHTQPLFTIFISRYIVNNCMRIFGISTPNILIRSSSDNYCMQLAECLRNENGRDRDADTVATDQCRNRSLVDVVSAEQCRHAAPRLSAGGQSLATLRSEKEAGEASRLASAPTPQSLRAETSYFIGENAAGIRILFC
jgi:hypothetical protein